MTNKHRGEDTLSDVALLDIGDVCSTIRMSKSWVLNEVVQRRFPQPMRIGPRCNRWSAADVRGWLLERAARAPAKAVVKRAAVHADAASGVCA